MKALTFLIITFVAMAAQAEPREMSQNPRVGLLAEINFAPGSSSLPDASGSQLGRIAAWANENFDGLIVLDGHADRSGTQRDNIRLSLRRARVVREQLINLGVDPSQLVITAFGAEGRKHARVAVWGTRNSLESVIAARRGADAMIWGHREPVRSSPTLTGRR